MATCVCKCLQSVLSGTFPVILCRNRIASEHLHLEGNSSHTNSYSPSNRNVNSNNAIARVIVLVKSLAIRIRTQHPGKPARTLSIRIYSSSSKDLRI